MLFKSLVVKKKKSTTSTDLQSEILSPAEIQVHPTSLFFSSFFSFFPSSFFSFCFFDHTFKGCPEQVRGGVAVEDTTRVACRPPKQFASHRPGDDRRRVSPTQLQREHEIALSFSSSRHEPRDAGSTPAAKTLPSHTSVTGHHTMINFFFFSLSLSRKKKGEKRRNRKTQSSGRWLSHLEPKPITP